MVYALESVGQLVLNLSLFGTGIALSLIGLVLAISRSTTKNSSHWAITFSAFAWAIALILPNILFSGLIFAFGAFALSLSFMPILEKVGDRNIFVLAVIGLLVNGLLVFGGTNYSIAWSWTENYDSSNEFIYDKLNDMNIISDNNIPQTNLCKKTDGDNCQSDMIGGSYDHNIFNPFASVLTIGRYLGYSASFIALSLLATTVLSSQLAGEGHFQNGIILLLMGVLVNIWYMAILIKLFAFIFNRRGMK